MPQLDHVSLRIDDPGKLAVLRAIDFVEDVAALRFERRARGVNVVTLGTNAAKLMTGEK